MSILNTDSSWYRFGLPIGSALVLAGLLDAASNVHSYLIDFAAIIIGNRFNNATKAEDNEIAPMTVVYIAVSIIWNAITIFLYFIGIILHGNIKCLYSWLFGSLAYIAIISSIWLYAIYSIWGYWNAFFAEVYSLTLFLLISVYILMIGYKSIQPLAKGEAIEPIGKGLKHLLKFYKDDPNVATKFLLISELAIILEYFFTRQIFVIFVQDEYYSPIGHEGDFSGGLIAEEYVMRVLRAVICSIGLFIIAKGELSHLKYWCYVYLGGIFISTGIFIYVLFQWNAEHIWYTIAYYFLFLSSIFFRILVFLSSVRVVQPFISSNSFLTLEEN